MVMTLQRIATLRDPVGEAYLEVEWDDPQINDDTGQVGDPNADYLIYKVIYQNLSGYVRHAQVGARNYEIPTGTPRTQRSLNPNQRTRLDELPYWSFY